MKGKLVEVAKGRNVLLFDDGDLQDTVKPGHIAAAGPSSANAGPDPTVAAGINRYMQKQSSKNSDRGSQQASAAQEEEHTGITDDEHDTPDADPDYEVVGRHTLKASNQALAEVMMEVKGLSVRPAPQVTPLPQVKPSPSNTTAVKKRPPVAPPKPPTIPKY